MSGLHPTRGAPTTTRRSRLRLVVLPSARDVGRHVGASIAQAIEAATLSDTDFVLGCPSGRSPLPVLAELAKQVASRDLDLRRLQVVMMDEYLVPDGGGGFTAVDPTLRYSCRGFALRCVVAVLNRAARPGRGMGEAQVWLADTADPGGFDETLERLGGIDLFLLATGSGDGHVAFNPPGSARDSRTRIVELATTTRVDNLATFPTFRGLDDVPTHGITVGIGTILRNSRRAVMVAHGSDKARAVARIVGAAGYDPSWPASVVVECRDPTLVVDSSAAASLQSDR